MVSKIVEERADRFKTVGTINRPCIATRGIFSKGRSHMLDKLLLCPITLYLIRKFYAFGLRLGKFFYGGSMGFLKYVNLLANESDAFAEYLVALNRREGSEPTFKGCNK
ncbi:Uncharacterised protein [Enterobacter hormaechei]|nr:hypothetical protein ASU69_20630 [Enterobacter hormaechei subsp. oharae]CZV43570.1 Uncharacterised protein [Enterobacter hormaechei]KTK15607.1 hypothetical protein ASU68_21340 [Enterobacter hormaechei subsp. oharae]CZV49892.1 Uncharacterised protein [Enterobacter hormaechei]CZV78778.1 Uncharacterised protein [Enterobacter hormaechei]